MNRPRIIPVLQIHKRGLVKTANFKIEKYIGDPINAVRILDEKEVDELVLLDISASKERRGPDFELIRELAQECFMPLCYGGGVTNLTEFETLFQLGVEKVAVNSECFGGFDLVSRASNLFGSQSVVVSIDVKRNFLGGHAVFSHSGRQVREKNPAVFAKNAQDAGAGEIFLTSVDQDGSRSGFDLPIICAVASQISVPLIACGGGGELSHFRNALVAGGASAAAGGSFFVLHGKHKAVLITYPDPDKIAKLIG